MVSQMSIAALVNTAISFGGYQLNELPSDQLERKTSLEMAAPGSESLNST
jgi:hypothetical protein